MNIKKLSYIFKKLFFTVLVISFFTNPILSEKIGNLNGVMKPFMLKAGINRVFISDQNAVVSYSIDNVNFINKLGGKGEGPGQFREEPSIKVIHDGLLLHSHYRLILFSRTGELLKQIKSDVEFFDINKVKDNYVLFQLKRVSNMQNYILSFTVKDSNLTKIKTIVSNTPPEQRSGQKKKKILVEPIFKFQSFNERIYVVSDPEGKFIINVFDHKGTLLSKIQKKFTPDRITESYKKKKMNELKNHPALKKNWAIISKKMNFSFPEYFPAMQDFRVRDGKIYIKTYKSGNGGIEFLVLSLNGKLLHSSFLPDIKTEFYDIRNNRFYYLNSNEDQEMWELHSIKIKESK